MHFLSMILLIANIILGNVKDFSIVQDMLQSISRSYFL